jgi:hypothetical protein
MNRPQRGAGEGPIGVGNDRNDDFSRAAVIPRLFLQILVRLGPV